MLLQGTKDLRHSTWRPRSHSSLFFAAFFRALFLHHTYQPPHHPTPTPHPARHRRPTQLIRRSADDHHHQHYYLEYNFHSPPCPWCSEHPVNDHDAMRCVREQGEGTSINHSRLSTIRFRRFSRVSMSGQISLSTHDVGAASPTATHVQERTVLPPLSRSVSTEQCESKQCHPSSDIREGKSNDYRDVAVEGTAPPKQLKLPTTASATQQEASAQERHDAKGEDHTRNSHPPAAGRNEYHTNEKPDEGNNNNSAAAETRNTRIVTMNLWPNEVASVTAEMSTKADDSAPLTVELFADMESASSPSSPSKKKKKNKKKKVSSLSFTLDCNFAVPLIFWCSSFRHV